MFQRIILLLFLIFTSCNFEQPTQFSKKSLQDKMYSFNGTEYTFQQVLEKYKGKKIVIDVWASWCRDCIKGLPSLVQLQNKFPSVTYLFLSVDKNKRAWKSGVKRYAIKGEHYNLPKGMKRGALVEFLNVNWIPRYVVVDENGKITLFKATRASDNDIEEALQTF